jgi:hypothetical protein
MPMHYYSLEGLTAAFWQVYYGHNTHLRLDLEQLLLILSMQGRLQKDTANAMLKLFLDRIEWQS